MADQDQTLEAGSEQSQDEGPAIGDLQKTVADLTAKLEATIAAQSGSDRKVAQLTAELTEARAAKETTVKTAEERIAELEQRAADADAKARRADLRSVGRALLDAESLKPPAYFDRLIGNDEEETKALVAQYISEKKAEAVDQFNQNLSDNGRRVDGPKPEEVSSYDKLLQMPPEQLARMNPKDIASIINKAI